MRFFKPLELFYRCAHFSVPSAPPGSVYGSVHTSTSLTIHWGLIDCIHRNGDITGYYVWYSDANSGRKESKFVSGGSVTENTISNLKRTTAYLIRVAAVNSIGTGVYSDTVNSTTRLSEQLVSYLITCLYNCSWILSH